MSIAEVREPCSVAFACPEVKRVTWMSGMLGCLGDWMSHYGLYTRGFLPFSALLTLPLLCSGEQSSGW